MEYKIKVMEFEAQPTLTMRETQPVDKLPEFFGKAFGGVMAYLEELGRPPGGMPFGKYYNLDMQALDIEAGFPVMEKLPGKGDILSSEIPAGTYISTIHEGPYDKMEPAYDALKDWAEKNGYAMDWIAYEYYLNDPTEGEGIIPLTEVRFPVKKI